MSDPYRLIVTTDKDSVRINLPTSYGEENLNKLFERLVKAFWILMEHGEIDIRVYDCIDNGCFEHGDEFVCISSGHPKKGNHSITLLRKSFIDTTEMVGNTRVFKLKSGHLVENLTPFAVECLYDRLYEPEFETEWTSF